MDGMSAFVAGQYVWVAHDSGFLPLVACLHGRCHSASRFALHTSPLRCRSGRPIAARFRMGPAREVLFSNDMRDRNAARNGSLTPQQNFAVSKPLPRKSAPQVGGNIL